MGEEHERGMKMTTKDIVDLRQAPTDASTTAWTGETVPPETPEPYGKV